MHAASREALAKVSSDLDAALAADNTMAVAAQAGTELFDVVDIL
ncbi:MAG: F0F1 ATP synthase subunit delta, partial [Corynebacterium sp.]|nr:F0F1 ATP synthase subunit delta [Corynebacterium sp.]